MKKRNKVNAEFSMSSLTDIIFLLLIFFMLTANTSNPNAKDLDRPKSDSKTTSPQNVFLSVMEDGKYFIGQKEVKKRNLEQELAKAISLERKRNIENKVKTEVTIVLNISMEETTGTIVDFMKMSNELGVRLILATQPTAG